MTSRRRAAAAAARELAAEQPASAYDPRAELRKIRTCSVCGVDVDAAERADQGSIYPRCRAHRGAEPFG